MFALLAFNLEIARVREQVSEPLIGRIRLQWWREAVDEIYAGRLRRHEVVEPLGAAIVRHRLDRGAFEQMIEAREADLDGEPPATMRDLEKYAEATAGALSRLALDVLGMKEAPAREATRRVAVAWALTGLLRASAFHARARRIYLPAALLGAHGLDVESVFAMEPSAGLSRVAETVAELARAHLGEARRLRADVPRAALPALLPARLADAYLRTLTRAAHDPFAPALARPLPHAAARLAWWALLGRY